MSLTTVKQHGQTAVDMFNQSANTHIGASVYYLKSELEGKVRATISKPAYLVCNTPVCELEGLGTALLSKIEPAA